MMVSIHIENGYAYCGCICDGTYIFMHELRTALETLGCTDIQTKTEEIDAQDYIPWLTVVFTAWGKLPEDFDPEEAKKKFEEEPPVYTRFKDTPLTLDMLSDVEEEEE